MKWTLSFGFMEAIHHFTMGRYMLHRCIFSLQNKCRTVNPDRQNLGWSAKLSFFMIYKFWQNCALVRKVSDLILITVYQPAMVNWRMAYFSSGFAIREFQKMWLFIKLKCYPWKQIQHKIWLKLEIDFAILVKKRPFLREQYHWNSDIVIKQKGFVTSNCHFSKDFEAENPHLVK